MIIELFSGIGRFETDEQVIYISNNIKTKPTILADVRYLPLKKNICPRILHGSPPCRHISKNKYPKLDFRGVAETFRLYAAFWDAVDWLKPEIITFESPQNIEKWIGQKIVFHHPKYDIKSATTNLYILSNKQMKRAKLAPEVRKEILHASDS